MYLILSSPSQRRYLWITILIIDVVSNYLDCAVAFISSVHDFLLILFGLLCWLLGLVWGQVEAAAGLEQRGAREERAQEDRVS